jgi:O-antigen ligase
VVVLRWSLRALLPEARPLHIIFVLYLLVWASGAAEPLLICMPHRNRQLLAVANGLVTIVLLRPASDRFAPLLRAAWPILPPVLFAALSCLWSLAPLQTARGVVMLIGTVAIAACMTERFSVRDQVKLFALALTIAGLVAVVVVLAIPQYGVMAYMDTPAWRGSFGHKNTFGGAMAFLGLAALVLTLTERAARAAWLAVLLFAVWLMVQSASRSGQAACVVSCAVAMLCVWLRGLDPRAGRIPVLVVAGAGVASLAWVALHFADAMALLGRDATLTSRTRIWSAMFEAFEKRPWLGYGHDAFWTGAMQAAITLRLRFNPRHGHNGFFDLALELGLIGVVLFVVPFTYCLWRAARVALAPPTLLQAWPLLCLVFLLSDNVAASRLMRENRLSWVVYVSAVLNVTAHRMGSGRPAGASD